jgi:predicted transcriptional regulator YdeE
MYVRANTARMEENMNYELVELEEKTVVGVTARTKNSDENMPNIIGGLWNSFYQDVIYPQIMNKINQKALGIYSDYESDVNSEYSVTVSCEVSDVKSIPVNTVTKAIPAGKYAKFIVRGHMQKAVADFWSQLWQMDLERSYICDFEEYQDCNMEDAEIHIYISIK